MIIDSDAIHHPHLIEPASAVILSQEAYSKYVPRLAEGGILCIDAGLVILPEDHRQDLKTYGIEATRIAEELGNVRAANTVMLGLWTAIIEAVSKPAMRQSLADAVPPKTLEVNARAFDVGYEEGKRLKAANGV